MESLRPVFLFSALHFTRVRDGCHLVLYHRCCGPLAAVIECPTGDESGLAAAAAAGNGWGVCAPGVVSRLSSVARERCWGQNDKVRGLKMG